MSGLSPCTFVLCTVLLVSTVAVAKSKSRGAKCDRGADDLAVGGIESELALNGKDTLASRSFDSRRLEEEFKHRKLEDRAKGEKLKLDAYKAILISGKKSDKNSKVNPDILKRFYSNTQILHNGISLARRFGSIDAPGAKTALSNMARKFHLKKGDQRLTALHNLIKSGNESKFTLAMKEAVLRDSKALADNKSKLEKERQAIHDELEQRKSKNQTFLADRNERREKELENFRKIYDEAIEHTDKLKQRAEALVGAYSGLGEHMKTCHKSRKTDQKVFNRLKDIAPPNGRPPENHPAPAGPAQPTIT